MGTLCTKEQVFNHIPCSAPPPPQCKEKREPQGVGIQNALAKPFFSFTLSSSTTQMFSECKHALCQPNFKNKTKQTSCFDPILPFSYHLNFWLIHISTSL